MVNEAEENLCELYIMQRRILGKLTFICISCRFDSDFGQEKEILKWIMNYLDATKAGLLTHLLSDGGPISISYKSYDWSMNC